MPSKAREEVTRKFEDVTKNLQEVVEELSENPHEFILDGEVIPFHRSPKSFQLLMRRLRRKYLVRRRRLKRLRVRLLQVISLVVVSFQHLVKNL